MKIDHVEIINFRSIRSARLLFDRNLKILIGKNESGKSNILKACSLLGDYKADENDVRMSCFSEELENSGCVKFGLSFSGDDIVAANNSLFGQITSFVDNAVVIGKNKYSIFDYISLQYYKINVVVDFCSSMVTMDYVRNADVKLCDSVNIYAVSNNAPEGYSIAGRDLSGCVFFLTDRNIESEYVRQVGFDVFNGFVEKEVEALALSRTPRVVRWDYAKDRLLPAEVGMESFFSKPDVCEPLRNMFTIAGYIDDKAIIDGFHALNGNRTRLRNMLRKVAEKVTDKLRCIWPDGRVSFELIPDGGVVQCSVRDFQNSFSMALRSDGFKRIAAFMLDVAAMESKSAISSCLIVMDEPDVGLHPEAIRMLREELCRLSDKYQILISTHATSMIDRFDIDKHVIVSKKDEVTTLERPRLSSFFKDEVLFQALTDSVFSVLKEYNFIIEGWYDKVLFDVAMNRYFDDKAKLKLFDDVGVCYAGGCKNIKNITPMFEAAKRKCFVISDSDSVAIRMQNEFIKVNMYGTWLTYSDILRSDKFITAEDFLDSNFFKTCASDVLKYESIDFSNLNYEELASGNRMSKIKEFLNALGLDVNRNTRVLGEIKRTLFEKMTHEVVVDEYYEVFNKALKQIKKSK